MGVNDVRLPCPKFFQHSSDSEFLNAPRRDTPAKGNRYCLVMAGLSEERHVASTFRQGRDQHLEIALDTTDAVSILIDDCDAHRSAAFGQVFIESS
jgi:hypothetical protein